jgi:hypothetical protein
MDTPLVAAVIAAVAAVFAASMSWLAASRARRSSDRAHAWQRITWAVDPARTPAEYDISRTVLRQLGEVPWVPSDDRVTVRVLLDRSGRPRDDERNG